MAKGESGFVASNKTYQSALETAESKIYNDSVETAVLLDSKGNIIFTESGGETSAVYFTAEQTAKMKGANLTHNHPQGSTFSPEDVAVMTAHGLNSIRATGKERTYQLSVIKGSPQNKEFANDYQKARSENKKVTGRLYKECEKQYHSGHISYADFQSRMPELNRMVNHLNNEWLKKNSHKYGYEYSVIERR